MSPLPLSCWLLPLLLLPEGGRYLQDMWVYNLNKLQWSAPVPAEQQAPAEAADQEGSALLAPAGPPAAAGWSVTPLGDKLLIIGGHVKVAKVSCSQATAWITSGGLLRARQSWLCMSPASIISQLSCNEW